MGQRISGEREWEIICAYWLRGPERAAEWPQPLDSAPNDCAERQAVLVSVKAFFVHPSTTKTHLSNSRDMGSQGWTSSPNERGTLDVVWTCLSTLALCAWSAVHPNIPLEYRFWNAILDRVGLMVLAIIFPEMIISSALTQRRHARKLLSQINQSRTQQTHVGSRYAKYY